MDEMTVDDVVDVDTLAAFLRERRLFRGMGLKQLSERSGLTTRTLINYEAGGFGTIFDLSKVLHVLELDDFDTILKFALILNATKAKFTFRIDDFHPSVREKLVSTLVTLSTLVSIRDVCPASQQYSGAAVELLGRSLRDGRVERSDSWLELLRHSDSRTFGGGAESSERMAEVASAY